MKPDTPLNPPVAVGYVRVSTEEQAHEGVSLDAQRAKVVAYCGLHGLELAQTYADEGLSAKRADNRPGLQGAITHACASHCAPVVYRPVGQARGDACGGDHQAASRRPQ